jgi:hypothetical protein
MDPEHVYMMTADADGVVFDSIWRGVYDMTVVKDEFELYTADSIVIEEGGLSMDVELIETIVDPYGLMVTQEGFNANFSWNNSLGFTDDFESYDDFVLEFSPWILNDVDGLATYGFNGVTFPNTGAAMAGIIFNPNTTDPALTESPAYSGEKYVAVFNPADATACSDWVISPKTQVMPDGQVSFWARGGHADYSAEQFQVFVSTTDTDPASFTAITDVITCPAGSVEWMQYSYSLDAYAGQEVYVGLHITSVDQFYFCLDDFEIGAAKSSKAVLGYNVYFDGSETPINTELLTETNYTFEDLTLGTYTASVEAVFESGTSELVTIEFDIVEPTYELMFNVMEEETSNLMEGVSISLTDGVDIWTNTTDANGQIMFEVHSGTYYYTATMDGYDTMEGEVIIDYASESVDVMMPLGIGETTIPGFVVYPNPSEGSFTVQADANGSIVVLDAVGQVVMEKSFNDATSIDLTNSASGVYFIRLMTENKVNTKRIIIE